jgi:hypothetical protein
MRVDGMGVCLVAHIRAGQRVDPMIDELGYLDLISVRRLTGLELDEATTLLPARMATKKRHVSRR